MLHRLGVEVGDPPRLGVRLGCRGYSFLVEAGLFGDLHLVGVARATSAWSRSFCLSAISAMRCRRAANNSAGADHDRARGADRVQLRPVRRSVAAGVVEQQPHRHPHTNQHDHTARPTIAPADSTRYCGSSSAARVVCPELEVGLMPSDSVVHTDTVAAHEPNATSPVSRLGVWA